MSNPSSLDATLYESLRFPDQQQSELERHREEGQNIHNQDKSKNLHSHDNMHEYLDLPVYTSQQYANDKLQLGASDGDLARRQQTPGQNGQEKISDNPHRQPIMRSTNSLPPPEYSAYESGYPLTDKPRWYPFTKCQIMTGLVLAIVITAAVTAGITCGIYAAALRSATSNNDYPSSLSAAVSARRESTSTSTTTASLVTARLDCPSNFDYSSKTNLCYTILTQLHTWTDSHAACSQLHPAARLVVFDSIQQQQAVKGYIDALSPQDLSKCNYGDGYTEFYTSGQRRVEGDCTTDIVWKPNLQPPFIAMASLAWSSGQPDCFGNGESCVTMWLERNSTLNDVPCSYPACPICQIR